MTRKLRTSAILETYAPELFRYLKTVRISGNAFPRFTEQLVLILKYSKKMIN